MLAVLDRANHIASMTSLEDLLGQMLDLMIEVSGATNGTLYLLDKDARELEFMVVRGNADDQALVGKRIRENVGIVGFAVQRQQPVVIADLSSDPRWYREFNPELAARLRNAITFPLLLQGKAIGAVQIFNFVRAELELLQVLGNRMASEVDKVLLLQKARRSNQRLQSLVVSLGELAATLDRDQLINLLTEHTTKLLEADKSFAYLAEGKGEDNVQLMGRSSAAGGQGKNGLPVQAFLAHSTISAPLSARPIIVGKERGRQEERTIGSLMALDKKHGEFDTEDIQLLEILASQASTVLQISALYGQASQLFLDFIKVLTAFIDAKDPYTRGHSQRVSDYSVCIAQELGIRGDLLHDIRIGSLLHDIGKIGVPEQILTKPDKLTTEEFDQMKRHPGIGYKIMYEVQLVHNVLPAIVEHHERLDGRGYPFGLKNDQISLMGRIVAVADVYDALTTDRPYRKALDQESVLDYLHQQIGTQFDSTCVNALTSFVLRSDSLENAGGSQ